MGEPHEKTTEPQDMLLLAIPRPDKVDTLRLAAGSSTRRTCRPQTTPESYSSHACRTLDGNSTERWRTSTQKVTHPKRIGVAGKHETQSNRWTLDIDAYIDRADSKISLTVPTSAKASSLSPESRHPLLHKPSGAVTIARTCNASRTNSDAG
jgi:hypothetical protein